MSRARCARGAGALPSSHDPASESPVDRARTDFRPFPALPTQVVSDIRPEPELKQDYIERNPVITTVQVVPDLSEHEVRPATASLRSQSRMPHLEANDFLSFSGFRDWFRWVKIAMRSTATRPTLRSTPLASPLTARSNPKNPTRAGEHAADHVRRPRVRARRGRVAEGG